MKIQANSYQASVAAVRRVANDPYIPIQPKLYYIYHWMMFEYTGRMVTSIKKRHQKHCDILNMEEQIFAFQKKLRKL